MIHEIDRVAQTYTNLTVIDIDKMYSSTSGLWGLDDYFISVYKDNGMASYHWYIARNDNSNPYHATIVTSGYSPTVFGSIANAFWAIQLDERGETDEEARARIRAEVLANLQTHGLA